MRISRSRKAIPRPRASLYVTGRAQLLAGDFANAFRNLKSAYDREKRPLYAVGLAQAYGEASMWKEGLAALEPVISVAADHPSTVIERVCMVTPD